MTTTETAISGPITTPTGPEGANGACVAPGTGSGPGSASNDGVVTIEGAA